MKTTPIILLTFLPLAGLLFIACSGVDKRTDVAAEKPAPIPVTIMTFNVQNLFDTTDDAGKDDKAYLPIEAKQSEAHIAECNEIEVASWRDECLNLDWNEDVLRLKMSVLADAILQVGDGRGATSSRFRRSRTRRFSIACVSSTLPKQAMVPRF